MSQRPTRERKAVERLTTVEPSSKEEEELVIKDGPGTKLGEIGNVEFKLQKSLATSEELRALHRACYGRPGNKNTVKKNLRKFSGFSEEDQAVKAKGVIERLNVKVAKKLLEVCDLPLTGTKQECSDRLLAFLKEPTGSGRKSLAEKVATKKQKTEKKAAAKEKAKPAKSSKAADGLKRPPGAFFLYCSNKRQKVKEENPDADVKQVAKILGEKWASISQERKDKYKQQAAELKADYDKKKAKLAGKGGPKTPAKAPPKKPKASPAKGTKRKAKEMEKEEEDEEEEDKEEEEQEEDKEEEEDEGEKDGDDEEDKDGDEEKEDGGDEEEKEGDAEKGAAKEEEKEDTPAEQEEGDKKVD